MNQFYRPNETDYIACRALWALVMIRAFDDLDFATRLTPLTIHEKRIGLNKRKLRNELKEFFSEKHPMFVAICDTLDLSTTALIKRAHDKINKYELYEKRKNEKNERNERNEKCKD